MALSHLELDLMQIKMENKKANNILADLARRAICAERRQQRALPSLLEDEREFEQAEWSSVCSIAFLVWVGGQAFYECYWNPILRFLCCIPLCFGRLCSCLLLKKAHETEQKKKDKRAYALYSFLKVVPGQKEKMQYNTVYAFCEERFDLDCASISDQATAYWAWKKEKDELEEA